MIRGLEPNPETRQSISIATRAQGAGADTTEANNPTEVDIDGEDASSELFELSDVAEYGRLMQDWPATPYIVPRSFGPR